MLPSTANTSQRRSKRQQGLDVSPFEVTKPKKNKKQQPVLIPVVEDDIDKNVDEAYEQVRDEDVEHEKRNQELDDDEEQEVEISQPLPEDTIRVSNSNEDAQTQQSINKKRKTRGPSKLRKLAKHLEDKVDVEFTALGEHVGDGSVKLSSFLGALVKEHVPVTLDDWRYLDDVAKHVLWEEIQGRFNVREDEHKHSLFKQMGCLWRSSKAKLLRKVRAAKTNLQVLELRPSNIPSVTVWKNWVKSRNTTEFKERSERYKQLRKAQIPHTTSRKGMTRLAHSMKKNSSDPSKVTRSKVWVKGHTHSDGRPVNPEFAETIDKIISLDSEMDSTSNTNVREDAVSQVLGKDKPGRIRGMGRGVTFSKLAFMQIKDSHVQQLEAKQTELISKVEDLQNVVRDLAGKNKQFDIHSKSEASDSSPGVRCQLLDLNSDGDVVVGEGEFCSNEPTYKIGRKPLGLNATAVVVKSVFKDDAYVWRPTPTIISLGQAVGGKIAWPSDKLILDSDGSTTENKTASSMDTSSNRVRILDWNSDEVIAEGILCSTDQNEMVNNVRLGPNAAIIKVDLVVKGDAFLWRPSADMSFMCDALYGNIIWPIQKIENINLSPREESPYKSSTACLSNTSASSKGPKKMCVLVDVHNSGQRVAEGRVLSTNPADVVHFVPLGLNASKVWVEVAKIQDAKVWRPNSEIQFISDTVGTTVAWPNDKLILF